MSSRAERRGIISISLLCAAMACGDDRDSIGRAAAFQGVSEAFKPMCNLSAVPIRVDPERIRSDRDISKLAGGVEVGCNRNSRAAVNDDDSVNSTLA